ncbi:efflux RND transporter permease subunit [Thermithiobacillus plumbiphilus]|uniref:Efflux RND transporter permease subunit n=1 Tax=Thermithiobacillus plumbiphilus TaxID=1729899 RepID=A0ABU9D584_9PROT
MSLPELSIKRHVLAFMLSGVLILLGIVAFQRLGVDRFPKIDFPVVSITTVLPGANPDVVDASITSIIETQVNGVPGIDHIQSSSSPGISMVNITFDLDKDVDVAFNEVQAKINQVLSQLPEDADPPMVAKVETDAQPILWLTLQGDRTQQQLNEYARTVLKKRLETINGVGEVQIGGRRDRAIRVNLEPARLAAYGLTVQDLATAFQSQHFQLPGGFLVSGKTERLIKLDLEYHDPAAMRDMVIGYQNGAAIHLRDVATVEDDLEDFRQLARYNGKPTVGLGIVKIANTNTVAIVDAVKERVRSEIQPELPPGLSLEVAVDNSNFILELIAALEEHLILGTLLAALVVWLFLKSFRSTLIISLAIPVSLLGAMGVMYFAGYTFNSMTMLALLLLIGVVVDDAIVVLENIYRHREEIDPDPMTAALNGTNQVMFAVMAATLTLVSIFAPVIFMGGIIGRFFQSFAVVVTFGVLVSWFVSMTLTPMLASRFLVVKKQHGRVYNALEGMFQGMERHYRSLLGLGMRHRWGVVIITVLVVASSGFFLNSVGKGFVPEEDEGSFLVFVRAPLGSGIEYTSAKLAEVEQVLGRNQAVAGYFTAIGQERAGQVNQAFVYVRMAPRDERELSQQALIPILQRQFAGIAGVRVFAAPVSIVGGQRGEPLQFVVSGQNLQEVAKYSKLIQDRLSEDPGMGRLDLDLQLDLPQIELEVDRERAASLGLSARDVAMAANVLAGGQDIAKFNDDPGNGERYDVRLKAVEGEFRNPGDMSKIYLRGRDGQIVRLDTVASFKQTAGPAVISRYDLRYAAFFYANPKMPLGDAVTLVKETAEEVLPLGYSVQFTGQAEEFGKTIDSVLFAFMLATILLYMVLASQFNSFLQPLIIMMAQPLAMIGGIAALWLTGHTLNIYSMIGLVLLVGLVAKNSILLVDLTNQYRAEGMDIDTALREASPIRLRPILMTSLTIILALLPAAIGLGAGADTNGPLAVAVIGGMITSTLLTLVVVPAVYSLVEHGKGRFEDYWQRRHPKRVEE